MVSVGLFWILLAGVYLALAGGFSVAEGGGSFPLRRPCRLDPVTRPLRRAGG